MSLRLKEILKEQSLTLSNLSEMTGITQANLSNILNGKISPTLDTLERIAKALNLDVADLFRKDEDIELMVKYHDRVYSITKEEIINLIKSK